MKAIIADKDKTVYHLNEEIGRKNTIIKKMASYTLELEERLAKIEGVMYYDEKQEK